MNLSELKNETAWISQIDQDFIFDISENTLWAVFSVDEDTNIPEEHKSAIDVYNREHDWEDVIWIAWEDADDDIIAEADTMRYIVKAN